jgi:predicted ChrR family anti-sigma factor
MTITRHPTDETLLRYAAGTLPEGPALVVAVHLALCGICQRQIRTCETLGGALIESLPPATLSADALAATLAKLDSLGFGGSLAASHLDAARRSRRRRRLNASSHGRARRCRPAWRGPRCCSRMTSAAGASSPRG